MLPNHQNTRRISEREGFRKAGERRGRNKRPCFEDNISPLPSRPAFSADLSSRVSVSRPVFLLFISVIPVRFLREVLFLSLSSSLLTFSILFKRLSSSDFCRFSRSCFSRATLPFCLSPSILTLPPAPIHAVPNLNPIFHITSRKSYSAVLGGAGSNATRLSHEGTTEHFYLLFASLFPLSSPSPFSPPSCRPK